MKRLVGVTRGVSGARVTNRARTGEDGRSRALPQILSASCVNYISARCKFNSKSGLVSKVDKKDSWSRKSLHFKWNLMSHCPYKYRYIIASMPFFFYL